MSVLKILMYTKGTGSGHLTRINAVYHGFVRAGINCHFYASAARSKYRHLLSPCVEYCDATKSLPSGIDIFICDWRSDSFTDSLPRSCATLWTGLRRLGKIKSEFPSHYHVIAIEPGVKGDATIWPIINVWPDELLSKEALHTLINVPLGKQIALLCENGAYPKHVDAVFNHRVPSAMYAVRCSNSPYSQGKRDISFYPCGRLFRAADHLVIGGGYNSTHEALCYADLKNVTIINVGGDDQALRIKNLDTWDRPSGSRADDLARHIVSLYWDGERIGRLL